MSAYKVGFCVQCFCQIMVRDVNGIYNSQKANYRQLDLIFDDGHRVRVPICSGCLELPNYENIMTNLMHKDSQIKSQTTKDVIKYRREKQVVEKEDENKVKYNDVVLVKVERGLPVAHKEFKFKV